MGEGGRRTATDRTNPTRPAPHGSGLGVTHVAVRLRPSLSVIFPLLASLASAQDRPALVVDLRGSPSPAALVSVRGLLDQRGVLSALESGFPLYMRYRVALRQSRSFRDRTVTDLDWEYVVLYDPVSERFTVETSEGRESLPDRDQLRARLARVYAVPLEPDGPGQHYYAAEVTVRMLTDEDVDEAFAWLRGESEDSAGVRPPGLLSRVARSLVVQVAPLPRISLNGRSRVFEAR